MGVVPLGGNEETHIIFLGGLPEHLSRLNANEQESAFTKLKNIATAEAPPDSYIYERIRNIDILRYSDSGRIYSKIITGIPEDDTQYHIIYVLFIDKYHDYSPGDLGEYSSQSQQKLEELVSLPTVNRVEEYLEDHNSISESEIVDMVDG